MHYKQLRRYRNAIANGVYFRKKKAVGELGKEATTRLYFLNRKGSKCSKVATAHDVYVMIVKLDVCAELESPEVKVPVRFSGTGGFPAPVEGRYSFPPPNGPHPQTVRAN